MRKQIVYIDMDGVLVDLETHIHETMKNDQFIGSFYKNSPDRIPGIFRNPPPMPDAIKSAMKLVDSGIYDVYIATAAPWGNPESSTDKRYWIEQYFGKIFRKRMVITHLKNLLIGDYLIDDRTANGAGDFGKLTGTGEHIHFGTDRFPDWNSVLEYLL
jgi:5'-nucleotidase